MSRLSAIREWIGSGLDGLSGLSRSRWLVLIGAAVVLPRLAWIAAMPTVLFDDFQMYDMFATRIARGLGYTMQNGAPTALWPVGYPAFLAAIYYLIGHHLIAVKLIQVGMACATVLIAYLMALPFSRGAARLAALFSALWPSLIGMVDILARENLFLPLFAACVLLFGRMADARPRAYPVLAGLALGAATLVTPLAAGIPLCAIAFAAARRRGLSAYLARIAGATLLAILVVLPWAVRNLRVFGALVPVCTSGGVNLWMGSHPGATGGYVDLPPHLLAATANMSEVERDRFFRRLAVDFARAHPLRALALLPRKLWAFAARDTVTVGWMHFDSLASPRPLWLKYVLAGIAQLYYVAALLFAAYGLARPGLASPQGRWLALVCAYYVGVHLVLRGDPRYHLPLLPVVAVFSALGLFAAAGQQGAEVRAGTARAPLHQAPGAAPAGVHHA